MRAPSVSAPVATGALRCIDMDEPARTDEQTIFGEVQKVINGLMKFDADSRTRIYRTVGAFFGFDDRSAASAASAGDPREPHFSTREEISPKDFLFRKRPRSEVDRVTCLAYYLTHHRDLPHFKTTEISKLNTEAAQTKLSNASQTVANAMRRGLLATAAGGAKQLSAVGEKYVEVLPDLAAAKALASDMGSRRSRKRYVTAPMESTESTRQRAKKR